MRKILLIIALVICLVLSACGESRTPSMPSKDNTSSTAEEYREGYEKGVNEAYSKYKDGIDAAYERGLISAEIHGQLQDAGVDCLYYKDDEEGGYSAGYNNGRDAARESLRNTYWGFYDDGIISMSAAECIESFT